MAKYESVAAAFEGAEPGNAYSKKGMLRMYEVSDDLRPMAEHLGMLPYFEQMRTQGYTVLPPTPETVELADAIRADVLRISKSSGGVQANRLLGHPGTTRGPGGRTAFERLLCEPRQAALAEYMCGAGFILGQLAASRKTARADAKAAEASPFGTGHSPGLHADQSWMPAPYAEHNLFLTTCLVTDDGYEREEGGATCVVPGTHVLKRAPPAHDAGLMRRAYAELRPLLARKGALVCWDGSLWHAGGWRREAQGERVVLHTTFHRLYVRPVEHSKYGVADEVLARNPPLMAQLVGRTDFLDHKSTAFGKHFVNTYRMALGGQNGVAKKLDWRRVAKL